MPYIGTQPTTGVFTELDALTASATADYALTLNGAAYNPATVNNLLVSINGVIQAGSTMSLSGNTLTVGATLSSSDVIDFVRVFGSVGTVSTPTDGSVTTAKLGNGSVTAVKLAAGVQGVAGITTASTSGTAMSIDSSNRILTPARPSFGARGYVGAVTGQGYSSTSYFGVIDHNIGSHFENSSTTGAKFTAPVAGVYHFIHFMGLRAAHNNFCSIHLDKNGAIYLDAWDTSTHGTVHGHITIAAYMELAVGDIVRAGWYTSYNAPSTGTNYGGFSGCFMG